MSVLPHTESSALVCGEIADPESRGSDAGGFGLGVSPGGGTASTGLFNIIAGMLRYRFFLVAGVFPYLLGTAVAYSVTGTIDWWLLAVGLGGIVFVSMGIEGMNEYFDSKIGGDRVFASPHRTPVRWHLPVGLTGFALALAAAICLTILQGWIILGFALIGGAAALSYLIPPVHLSYRGFGETVIALAYGVGLTLGSFYLQAGRLTWQCGAAALIPTLLMFAMALANEVPDYYGDRLVGKRNLIVRLGQRRGVLLYGLVLVLCFFVMATGLITGTFGPLLAVSFLLLPLVWWNLRSGLQHFETPVRFCRVIGRTILLYIIVNVVAISSYLIQ